MKKDKLSISVFIIGMCFVVPLATVIITIWLARDAAGSVGSRLGLLHQAPEPMSLIEVYPTGDIPQPETSNIANKLSIPQ